MKQLATLITLALLSCSAFATSDSDIYFLTPEQNELYRSEECQSDPKPSDEEIEMVQVAYTLEFCSNLLRIRDNNFTRGWELHTWARMLVDQLPCSCSLHNHANNLSYRVYNEVKSILDNGTPMSDNIENLCKTAKIEFLPLANKKGGT